MIRILNRIMSPYDARDYILDEMLPKPPVIKTKQWDFPAAALDQGQTGHCMGYGSADWGINLPVSDPYKDADGDRFYYACKVIDGEPRQENGSCVRSAAKNLTNMGRIKAYSFAHTITAITAWLLTNGPVLVGTEWTAEMFTPDARNIIHATGASQGGHCYILNGVPLVGFYHIQNSWGAHWGIKGGALISIRDFGKLFRAGGEALAAVELPL